jgi:FG-GAP repeat
VFFGRRTWNAPTTPYTSADANVTIGGGTGEFSPAALGSAVARAGDFDGDGLNDIAVGAFQSNTGRGAALVFLGRMTFPSTINPSAANVIIRNTSTESFFGRQIVGAGRVVGGDTREDLLIGYGGAGNGFLTVFAGRAVPTPISLTLADATLNRPGAVTTPATTGQYASGGVGDINGDGRSDIAIGAAGATPGRVALYFGNAAGTLTEGPAITTTSVATGDTFGSRFASIYDPNLTRPSLLVPGATAADLLVGAAGFGGMDPRVYIYAGRSSWDALTVSNADQTVILAGPASQPITGVNWVGDVDGDGFVDAAAGRATSNGTMIVLR